jgi:hypothetical protein
VKSSNPDRCTGLDELVSGGGSFPVGHCLTLTAGRAWNNRIAPCIIGERVRAFRAPKPFRSLGLHGAVAIRAPRIDDSFLGDKYVGRNPTYARLPYLNTRTGQDGDENWWKVVMSTELVIANLWRAAHLVGLPRAMRISPTADMASI